MPTLQIRLDDDTYERVRERGGSPWAREQLKLAAAEPTSGLSEDTAAANTEGTTETERAVELYGQQLLPAQPDDLEYCPRWMHHFAGRKCETCGQTP